MLRLLFAKINSVSSRSYRQGGATTGRNQFGGGTERDGRIGGPFGLAAGIPEGFHEDD